MCVLLCALAQPRDKFAEGKVLLLNSIHLGTQMRNVSDVNEQIHYMDKQAIQSGLHCQKVPGVKKLISMMTIAKASCSFGE